MISKIIMSLPVYLRLVFSCFTYIDSLRVDVSLHLRHINNCRSCYYQLPYTVAQLTKLKLMFHSSSPEAASTLLPTHKA